MHYLVTYFVKPEIGEIASNEKACRVSSNVENKTCMLKAVHNGPWLKASRNGCVTTFRCIVFLNGH